MSKQHTFTIVALTVAGFSLGTSTLAAEATGGAEAAVAPTSEEVAMEEPSSRGGVWFNPLGLIFGLLSVDVGVALQPKHALNFSASYWGFDLLGVENTSFGVGAGWQYFIIGETFGGFFVLPNIQAEYASIAVDGDTVASGAVIGPGALVGYQWDWKPFSLRLGGGFHYYIGSVEGEYEGDVYTSDVAGFSPDLDASIGFTW